VLGDPLALRVETPKMPRIASVGAAEADGS
jgi:hypothetical protein